VPHGLQPDEGVATGVSPYISPNPADRRPAADGVNDAGVPDFLQALSGEGLPPPPLPCLPSAPHAEHLAYCGELYEYMLEFNSHGVMYGSQLARYQMAVELRCAKKHCGQHMTDEHMGLLKHTLHMCSPRSEALASPGRKAYQLHREVWASVGDFTIAQHRRVFADPNLAIPKQAKLSHRAAQLYLDDPTDASLVAFKKAYIAERGRRTLEEGAVASIVAAPLQIRTVRRPVYASPLMPSLLACTWRMMTFTPTSSAFLLVCHRRMSGCTPTPPASPSRLLTM
jgi:hypothetical protein